LCKTPKTITGRLPYFGEYGSGKINVKEEIRDVPKPFTIDGTAVAGAMGLWMKRKQKACLAE
jgi:hypothetical protein